MKGITANVGKSTQKQQLNSIDPNQIKKVLISRPNHRLGNLLLITPLVQEVTQTFPNCKIDLFVKGNLAPIVFENYENIGQIIKLPKKHFKELSSYLKAWILIKKNHYDLAINVDKDSSSGRLSIQLANATYKFFGEVDQDAHSKYDDYNHIAKYPVYNLRSYLAQLGIPNEERPVPPLVLQLSDAEKTTGKEILDQLVSSEKKTICLFTFATGQKCYSKEWWVKFYERLKIEFEEYHLLEVLPIENVSQIGFQAPTFYSKDIREIAAFFSNTAVFIGADSGMMHLASAAQIPTIGLFSVTSIEKYKPYNANSYAIQTNESHLEDWIKIIHSALKN
ncbi:glycosyltransferase family 9 protein [Flavobacterium sp.]|uniref:glycosyltransferase family 9 protein n=1 Tax=Flavobacterium sp. TaxID=239 RepID=UPI00286E5109|nr:glycosyltransferase family 9 protein [Flavobacterium sp.]